ncbi:hypothetical protein TCON_0887 [Astathelohania contejeani]|uniref:Uncharacterized protein n=1 Tax=Astathelohania contejeani TaxID=164912 RepID=A0ABQ7I0G8_9MICR|nr:hypothetical protein TCON_0887 [Thelohania contejeani]
MTSPDNLTIGEILETYFPDNPNLTILVKYNKRYTQYLTKRDDKIKNVIGNDIIIKSEYVNYHIVDIREYIDAYLSEFMKQALKINKDAIRLYCYSDTTVRDIENELKEIFDMKYECGLFGLYENNIFRSKVKAFDMNIQKKIEIEKKYKNHEIDFYSIFENKNTHQMIFKLPSEKPVLFIKRNTNIYNFFQYQPISELDFLDETFSGEFYELKSKNDITIFKTPKFFVIKGNKLIICNNNRINKIYSLSKYTTIQIDERNKKYFIIIFDSKFKLILCNYDEFICEQMFLCLVKAKEFCIARQLGGDRNKNINLKDAKKRLFSFNDYLEDYLSDDDMIL